MMADLSGKNFGVVIAFLIPGYVALWGLGQRSPAVAVWLTSSAEREPTVASFMYVTMAAMAAGLTVSAVRWATIDMLHHATGVTPPKWEFAGFNEGLQGFLALVENHYRYYQFYANMAVATALGYLLAIWNTSSMNCDSFGQHAAVVLLEGIFLAGSRDSLQKYYRRVEQLFSVYSQERTQDHDKRLSPTQRKRRQEKRKGT
jgi:hypothetical protein